MHKLHLILVPTLLAAVVLHASAPAQGPTVDRKLPPRGTPAKMHTSVGVGLSSMYFFRGIMQQDGGLIVQPFVEISRDGMELFDLPVGWRLGSWNSLHEGQTGSGAGGGSKMWYESQFYTGFDVGVTETLTVSATYAALDGVNGGFRINNARGRPTTQELRFKGTLDDRLGDENGMFKGLFPYAELVFELAGGRDAGPDLGTYLELGVKPRLALTEDFHLDVPVRVGISVKDYYESATASRDTFGFLNFGGETTIDLGDDQSLFGPWKLQGRLEAYILGDNLRRFNNGDRFDVVGSVNLMLTF